MGDEEEQSTGMTRGEPTTSKEQKSAATTIDNNAARTAPTKRKRRSGAAAQRPVRPREKPPAADASVPEKLRYLQSNKVQRSGERWTAKAAVVEMTAAGAAITEGYYSEIRLGTKPNPSARMIQALADLYKVSPAYFFNDPAAVEHVVSQVELEVDLREVCASHVSACGGQLSRNQYAALNRAVAQALLRAGNGEDPNVEHTPGEERFSTDE
ncbi:hypothetical protein [Pseudonocardia sp. Ae717_Ps2]|uniref:hypothetical protein n=1 Tax=Pseudonocardia sp. Ae717_Ps2 TaxID=1885573 RepID=UPI000B32EC2D|nr:hypothetical protein [Pseudonocardia sp. Ae717_Ps2]